MLRTCSTIVILILAVTTASPAHKKCHGKLKIVSREEWMARPPTAIEAMANPVEYVVIHHSYIPGPCDSEEACEEAMREMQNMHMDTNGWADIGYSFAVGGDGRVYEGRGWSRVGAHAPGYNTRSIGICNIGDFRYFIPPSQQLAATKALIIKGVKEGWIAKDYKVIGHRQTKPTECPGQALFDEITTWPHFEPKPVL